MIVAGVHHPRGEHRGRRGSASDRRTGGCETARWRRGRRGVASRKTSRGWTTVVSSDPTDTIFDPDDAVLRVEHHDAELLDRPATRTAAADTPPAVGGDPKPWTLRARRAPACVVRARRRQAPARRARGRFRRPRAVRRASMRVRPCRPPACSSSRLATRARRTSRDPLPSTSASSSLSPSAAAPRRSSFSRGRSCGATSFIYTQILMRRLVAAWLCCARRSSSRRRLRGAPQQGNGSGAGRDRCRARRRRRSVRRRRNIAAAADCAQDGQRRRDAAATIAWR